MPRSTRARIRSESASLSLSLPTRRTRANTAADRNHPVGKGEERLDEGSQVSFASASTASLPERYIVKASHLPGEVWTAKEQDLLHVKGAEYISDGWRRGEMEGNVAELREIRRRERAGIVVQGASANAQLNDAPTEGSKLDLSVLWYSTPLVFPRLKDLETHQLHWTPRSLPPRAAALNSLEPLDPALVPLVGCHIPLWASNPLQDLDPAQDDLEDFANGWQDANGTGWDDKLLVKSLGKIEDWSLECDDAVEEVNTSGSADLFAPPEKVKTLDFNANRRVAHDKAAGLARPTDSVVLDSSDEAVAGRVPLMDVAPSSETDWIFQSKRRKKWWRDEIASKEGYNRLWDFIPRPHAMQPQPPQRHSEITSISPRSRTPPDFKLSRFYSQQPTTHPLHPHLSSYTAASPHARVYWTIPIVGPVHIPGWSDMSSTPAPKAPIPSSAILLPTSDRSRDALPNDQTHLAPASSKQATDGLTAMKRKSGRDLIWTPTLLAHFWTSFLLPLHADLSFPFGTISVRLSGPKPDPYIALAPPALLSPWPRLGETEVSSAHAVRPEMGDHIRLYCDLKHALALRTWIHSVEVDSAQLGLDSALAGNGDKLFRPFDKVRLVLIGHRGEALVVA